MRDFHKLRMRLMAVCAVSTGVVLVAMAAVSYAFSARQMREQFRESLKSSTVSVCSYLRDQSVITHAWLMRTERDHDLWLHIGSSQASLIYGAADSTRAQIAGRALAAAGESHSYAPGYGIATTVAGEQVQFVPGEGAASEETAPVYVEVDYAGDRYRVGIGVVRAAGDPLVVTAIRSTQSEQRQVARLGRLFCASVSAAMVCLLAFAWLFSGWATRPVEESRRRQVAFVGAASHEFRSPVAVIQMGAENIKKAPPELVDRFADTILRECGRLGRLTEDMLQLAGADSRNLTVKLEPMNPESAILSAHEAYEGLAGERGIALECPLPAQPLPKVWCDRQRIEQVLGILLDNAVRHTPEGGTILLAAERTRQGVRFAVEDSGPGIPDREKAVVFERFYRGDRSRTGKEHFGLGLSIALEIARLHSGELSVEDSPLGGSRFVLTLPFFPSP